MDLAKYRLVRAKEDLETAADNLENGAPGYRSTVLMRGLGRSCIETSQLEKRRKQASSE